MKRDAVYLFPPTDFHEQRDGRHLMVFGERGRWLVADADLHAFLGLFDGKRSLDRVLRRHARQAGKDLGKVRAEAGPVVEQLVQRGFLRERGESQPEVADEPLSIANLTLNVTNTCNLRCRWCYTRHHRSGEMEIDALMDRVTESFEAGLMEPDATLILLGGEPTGKPARLLGVLDRAVDLFSRPPMVSTNGTLLGPGLADALARRRCEVQVSLDGPTAALHDAVRGEGVFEKAVQGARNAVAAGAHTILSMVYTKDTVRQFEPYLDLAIRLGVAEARFIPLRRIGSGATCAGEAPDQMEALEHLLVVLDRRPELRRLLRRDWFSIQLAVCRHSASRNSCGIARRLALIDADGTIYPCPNHTAPEYACGNLAGQSLAAILKESLVMQDLRARYHVANFGACRECPFRRWCAGDCRGEALAVTGDPAAASPHCAALKRIFPRLVWMAADSDPRLGGHPRDGLFHG